jgi:hypothetical protein
MQDNGFFPFILIKLVVKGTNSCGENDVFYINGGNLISDETKLLKSGYLVKNVTFCKKHF